jgi:hypothetical protein
VRTWQNYARTLFLRLATEDDGQDLIEYALLTGIVVVVALLGLPAADELGDLYEGWLDDVDALWEPPAPSGET